NEEIGDAIESRLIALEDGADYRLNEDGSISLPLSQLEFVFNEQKLARREQRFNVLQHGRAGLTSIMDVIPREAEDELPNFLVSGVVFSPGPFYWKIRNQLDDEGK